MVLRGPENFWGLSCIRENLVPISLKALTLSLFLENQRIVSSTQGLQLPPVALTWRPSWPSSCTWAEWHPPRIDCVPEVSDGAGRAIGIFGLGGADLNYCSGLNVFVWGTTTVLLLVTWGSGQQQSKTTFISGLLLPNPLQLFFSLATFYFPWVNNYFIFVKSCLMFYASLANLKKNVL